MVKEVSALTEKGNITRDRILAAARDLLLVRGYEALVMRDVAARCDMKLGNLQYYFKSREDLVYAVIDAEAKRDVLTINKALAEHEDAVQVLDNIIEELLGRWRRRDGGSIYIVLSLLQLHNDMFRELYKDIYANHYAALETVIKALVPNISKKECQMRTRLLTALLDGAAYQIVPGNRSVFLGYVARQARGIVLQS